jgi:hypothetical protein
MRKHTYANSTLTPYNRTPATIATRKDAGGKNGPIQNLPSWSTNLAEIIAPVNPRSVHLLLACRLHFQHPVFLRHLVPRN